MNLVLIPFMLEKAKKRLSAITIEIQVGSTVCSLLFESRTLLMFQLFAECAVYTLGLLLKISTGIKNKCKKHLCISIGNK